MPALVTTRNFADNQVLFKVHLDTFLDDIEDWANNVKLDFENIQTGGIIDDNLASNSVTTPKINTAAVTLPKLATEVSTRLMPAGVMLEFGGAVAPAGYLLCDGTIVSRTIYAELFAAIGTAWGNGDGSTTFHLPDRRGYFARGVDGAAGVDPDAASRTALNAGGNTGNAVGSVQDSEFFLHNHGGGAHGHTVFAADGTGGNNTRVARGSNTATGDQGVGATGGFITPQGGNETRPKNVYVTHIIKT